MKLVLWLVLCGALGFSLTLTAIWFINWGLDFESMQSHSRAFIVIVVLYTTFLSVMFGYDAKSLIERR